VQSLAARVFADARDQHGADPQAISEGVQMAGDVERRTPRDCLVRKTVHQDFSEQQDVGHGAGCRQGKGRGQVSCFLRWEVMHFLSWPVVDGVCWLVRQAIRLRSCRVRPAQGPAIAIAIAGWVCSS
jgi:hypothetical protein